ncbi:MAG: D-2-hydroxyacid dehydrogenase [Caulobacterales bacterium]
MRLLIFEGAYKRVGEAMAPFAGQLELMLIDREGKITCGGETFTTDTAQPEAAWASGDMYSSRAQRDLMIALLKSSALRWVHSGAAGFDHPVFGQMVQRGVRLTTSHGQAISIAEFVLAEVLGRLQRLTERRREQAEGRWTRLPFREVMGSQWLVIGFGAIGQAVAERARGFGAKVTGVRRNQDPHPLADRIVPLEAAAGLAGEADVVVLSAPLNAATRHVVDAAFLAAMKPGSVLVNVGRGGLIDEPALIAALDKGTPEHAVLDVFETEPLPAESPLWRHPRVSLNPHASAFGSGTTSRNDAVFVENLRRYLAGEALISEIEAKDVVG